MECLVYVVEFKLTYADGINDANSGLERRNPAYGKPFDYVQSTTTLCRYRANKEDCEDIGTSAGT